ncbi:MULTISPECIES: preprotein translocase subunit SecA [Desulfococcus]|uniref:Protein translocase subunit SecA n=1 Tax=Desulfococcus multivorans DSM 2059 TaxID=1121405 RepID=S7U779_DESML|nr:preprotein translocase subunit SecA [Desulfococcus multivorans]AOY59193.1 SecA: protein translocase, subunit A [Desulfococcus multivorans]AQV01419.1 preprotein translocase subunit SecA [Desulfococcus multivorans]EPR45000.1 Protein translocase subunit secA [Desulfococcus multivorans DSM 2059]SJZ85353.1 protein translocase subunit secA [Desulfococcus multivorans DSM 2059]
MIFDFLTKVFGSKNERELKKLQPIVERINAFEPEIQALSDDALKGQTARFKERLERGEPLDDILPEAFATTREASIRTLKMRHFDVQLIGGIVLHQGKIAEMKTGEGKTLVSTLPAYLNALTGKGVHIVTVNDYLATRDAEWMGRIYEFLGLSVGTVVHGMTDKERHVAYSSDITYGTNNEFGFDYLRDNMKYELEALVQGELHFAIVDEVDSILIDEARTPLIISGPAEKSTHLYYQVNEIIPRFKRDTDYTIDEKARTSVLTEEGIAKAEEMLKVDNIYDPKNIEMLHHVNQALKAHTLFKRDVDYIVKNGEVVIVDEFTGRLMPGRRYSEGLHQALEAKENVKIENENQTLATITFQNYFRMYDKLAGMTGTADTEAAEFKKIYDLDVMVIPTHMPMIRKDYPDAIYKTRREKFDAVIREIQELYKKGQPVLVGTISIDISEELSEKLKKKGVKHTVLNAKHHAKEAEIVAMAGQPGAVTISTNMAGRGTDIVLGEGVKALGGLHIIGTERHESRRIDNQLRGRSGRQGDPGSSRFYLALEDDLLRIFGGDRITGVMDKLGMEEGEPIEHNLISRAIENAQAKVEAHNFDIRKHLLEYDDVMNQQREVIYEQRREALRGEDLRSSIEEMILERADEIAADFIDEKSLPEDWDLKGLSDAVFKQYNIRMALDAAVLEGLDAEGVAQLISDKALAVYGQREQTVGPEQFRMIERYVMLQTVDSLWKDHLLSMDHLKEGIGLRGYAQQNPLIVYKREGFEMFNSMIHRIKEEMVEIMFKIQVAKPDALEDFTEPKDKDLVFSGGDTDGSLKKKPVKRERKIGRNDPCPCGSGKKYKKCCGK